MSMRVWELCEINVAESRNVTRRRFLNVQTLAAVLDLPAPELPKEQATRVVNGGVESGGMHAFASEEMAEGGPWEDEEMRQFYESLPDLRALVPAVLLGGTDDTDKDGKEEAAVEGDDKGSKKEEQAAAAVPAVASKEEEGDGKEETSSGGAALQSLLLRLPLCVNRDTADAFALDFCYINSKNARRRLAKALFAAPRNALDLLPYYCRIAAALTECGMKDIAPPLVAAVEEEFNFLSRKKDQVNLEAKVQTTPTSRLPHLAISHPSH
jgi:regulator of nonsense transcripts 2